MYGTYILRITNIERRKQRRWRDLLCSSMLTLNIVKLSVLSKLIYRFNAIPIKVLTRLFLDINKIILQFIWKSKKTRIARTTFES